GLTQAAYDYAIAYLTGKVPGAPALQTEATAKGHALAEMLFATEAARALYYRAISEAQVDAPLAAVQRARAAHVTVQRSVVTVTQEAIRVSGGRAPLKRYPLERYARAPRAPGRAWSRASVRARDCGSACPLPTRRHRGSRRRARRARGRHSCDRAGGAAPPSRRRE